MPNTLNDHNFLTLTQAARLANRSYSWARNCAVMGKVETRRFGEKRRLLIAAESLDALLKAEIRNGKCNPRPASKKRAKSYLRLVVDNTK